MSEFVSVLIVAIVIFLALLLIFGGGVTIPVSSPNRIPEDNTIEFGSFNVFYTSSEDVTGHVSGEVSSGVFGSQDKRVGFQVTNPEEVSNALINLKIIDSNYYGKFIVFVNGKEVYADYPTVGEMLISFDPKVLNKNNVLEIKAESSGWKIWAPTVYDFDSNVVIDYLGRKSQSFNFTVSELGIKYLDKARVVAFGDRKGTGDLIVRINGVEVFRGVTTVYKDFPISRLRAGNNTIDFSTEAETTYDISSAQIILLFE
jgi:hypothetical protein